MLSDAHRAALSARLRQRPAKPVATTVATGGVRLNDGPADRKLVLFHAIGGTVYAYGHLARELAGDFQVWGVPAPEKDAGGADASLTSLIQCHLQVLRRLQPVGPYRLAGWSMGGILAYEIARILLSQGERVIAVGLLDSPYWLPAELTEDDAEFAGWFVSDATRSFDAALGAPPDPATTGVVEQLDWLADRLGGGAELRAALDQRYQAFRDNTEMLAGYRPSGPLASDTLIVDVEESPNMSRLWQGATQGRATLFSMAGTHYSFLQPPGVVELATAVRAAFRPAQHDTGTERTQ
jgi:thioesterase domain-containing protein